MPSYSFKYPTLLASAVTAASGASTAVGIPSKSQYQVVNLLCNFTLGSLTSITLIPQISYDGAIWFNVLPALVAITATGTYAVPVNAAGAKQVRMSYTTAGTVTGSLLAVDAVTQSA